MTREVLWGIGDESESRSDKHKKARLIQAAVKWSMENAQRQQAAEPTETAEKTEHEKPLTRFMRTDKK